jgi:hypothetical protein
VFLAAIPGCQGIVNRAPGAKPDDEFIHIQVGGANIYFPRDGKQPTTVQAASWSCANDHDEEVTKLYMCMFGWIPQDESGVISNEDGRRCKLGKGPRMDSDQLTDGLCPIIMLAGTKSDCYRDGMSARALGLVGIIDQWTMDQIQGQLSLDYQHNSSDRRRVLGARRRKLFWRSFRRIASDPVGRVLLYRIIIEIKEKTTSGEGTPEEAIQHSNTLQTRNQYRALHIEYGATREDWSFNTMFPILICNFDNPEQYYDIYVNRGGRTTTKITPYQTHVALFHELVHWYQTLRAHDRAGYEHNNRYNYFNPDEMLYHCGYTLPERGYRITDKILWRTQETPFALDEYRVICGSREGYPGYLSGDDISENAFRCSQKLPMRFGYAWPLEQESLDDTRNTRYLRWYQRETGTQLTLDRWVAIHTRPIRIARQNAVRCVADITGRLPIRIQDQWPYAYEPPDTADGS